MRSTAPVYLLNVGGTINAIGTARLGYAGPDARRLNAAQLLARIPEVRRFTEVETADFPIPGNSRLRDVGPAEWISLSHQLSRVMGSGRYSGAVVTHGTNLLEETAYLLHLTVRIPQPIVVVGAMLAPSSLGTDADLNLVSALRTAASPSVEGCGTLVLLNETIHSARDVRKVSTHRPDAFESPGVGPLGYVDPDGHIVVYRTPMRRHTAAAEFDLRDVSELPRVDVVASYAGQDATMIEAASAAGASGIVVAAAGAGWRTPVEDEALDRAIEKGIVVVLSTRVASGRVVSTPALRARGIVTGDDLGPYKARVLLMLALTRTRDPVRIQMFFSEY